MFLETDASGLGWGVVLTGTSTARGFHHSERLNMHINQ